MGWNLYEKIIMRHTGSDSVEIDDLVEVEVDGMMIHDFFAPFCINKFKEMGFSKIAKPESVAFIYDHLVPTSFIGDTDHHQAADAFVAEHSITRVHRSDGVCHQLMPEKGYVKPGDIIVGTDSHTVTYGALGAIATGIGYTEMASVLGTGRIWLKVVPTIKVTLTGALPSGVFSKDLILEILRQLTTNGASYRAIEFCGPVVEALDIDSRLTLANMSVEAGAKAGLIGSDEKTLDYLKDRIPNSDIPLLSSDADARYEKKITINVSHLHPLVAKPYSPDNVANSGDVNVKINQAFLGSCTNGRLGDLASAASILKNKKIHPDVRFYIVPASREVYLEAMKHGYLQTLIEAGGIVGHPACSLCAGRSGGILEDGETVISTNNRNFYGRMGGNMSGIYLGSAATVAASAIEGKITDCRNYL